MPETCKNPWFKECHDTDIELYIEISGERLPICKQCWERIADNDLEW